MGLSSSKQDLSDGSKKALGTDLASMISDMTHGDPQALQVADLIERMPKNGAPADDNLLQFMESNAEAIVDEIRRTTGLSSDQISSKSIITMVRTARNFGIQAIPYVVGIVATVAAANPAAGIAAGTAAGAAVNIADSIEKSIVNVAAQTKTPDFLKTLASGFGLAKRKLGLLLSKNGAYAGAYEQFKMTYGAKHGACDCDRVGSAEEGVGLVIAQEYLRTASSLAKINLAKDVNNTMSKFIKATPPSGLDEIEKANWLLAHMPGTPGNKLDIQDGKLEAAANSLIDILNKFAKKEVISKKLDKETQLVQAAEMLHALTVGMHLEFLYVQEDLVNCQNNLTYLGQLEQKLSGDIIDMTTSDMSEGQRLDALAKKDALKLVSEEIERQMLLVRAMTTGTINKADLDIMQLIKDGQLLRADISDISDQNPSNKSFRQMLYKLLNMVVLTGAVAAYIESALKTVGIKLEEYKNINTLAQLDSTINKMVPMGDDYKAQEKFFKAAEILKGNFNRRQEIKIGSFDSYSGSADRHYEKTDTEMKIDARKGVRKAQLKTFAARLASIYASIVKAIDDVIPFTEESIKPGNELNLFIDRLDYLRADTVLKGKTYEALAGAIKDPLALQVRQEIIGKYKALIATIESLANVSAEPGKGALIKLRDAINSLIELSDSSSESFKKIIGSADFSNLSNVEYGITKAILDLDKSIDRAKAYAKTAKVRENVKSIMSNYNGVDSKYETLVGQSVGLMINDINEAQQRTLAGINDATKLATTDDDRKRCGAASDFVTSQHEAIRNVWRAAEAVDYYLGNFTHDIRVSASEIKDITALLEDVAVNKDWYDSRTGNLLTGIYDNFPNNFDAATGAYTYPSAAMANNNGDQHYYTLLATEFPGHILYGADIKDHGLEALKKAKAFVTRFGVLKNIVTLFYDLGAKYGREKTKDSSRYMAPGSLLKVLMDYFHYGSFFISNPKDNASAKILLRSINARSGALNVSANGSAAVAAMKAANMVEYDKAVATCKTAFGMSLEDFADSWKDNLFGKLLGANITGTGFGDVDINIGARTGAPDWAIFMRSEAFDYMRGSPLLVKTDEMFGSLIKAMLAKILVCVETFEIMKRPLMYNVYNSGVRQILGGADLNVKPEFTELYLRLVLLVKFYKNIFKIDSTDGFEQYKRLDKSQSKNLKISMMPDVDGIYGPLVQYLFSNDRLGISNYTDSQVAVIIEKINDIIAKTTEGSTPEEKTKAVLKGFVRDINRRFTLVTMEDFDNFKKLRDEEHNLWGQVKTNAANDYTSVDSIVDGLDDEVSAFMRLPSDAYVSSSSVPGGIFGAERRQMGNTDRKYYGEYYQLYVRFRKMLDKYISDNTTDPKPQLGGSIKSLQKQIGLETNMTRRLEMISKFLDAGVNLSSIEKSKYVAFHEFVVSAVNGISIIDSFITYIVSCAYLVDPQGLGNAIIADRASAASVLGQGAITIADVALAADRMVLATGISFKTIAKILGDLPQTIAIAGNGALVSTSADKGKLSVLSGLGKTDRILAEHFTNILYAVSGHPLFGIRIGDNGVTVDYAALQDTIEKTYASVKSTMEKFRPHIDKSFFELYIGTISDSNNKNTVYELYEDLIRVKLNGAEVFGDSPSIKIDALLGRFYGLRQAFGTISEHIKVNTRLTDHIVKQVTYNPDSVSLALFPGNQAPTMTKWFHAKGSGIERMHQSFDGPKSVMDLRFAARYEHLYSWDSQFAVNKDLFTTMNQLVARFLGRCFDSSLEKAYKGCIMPFDKAFTPELNDPFNNAWPDIWPAVYVNKDGVVKAQVTDKDSYNIANDIVTTATVGTVAIGTKIVNNLAIPADINTYLSVLGLPNARYPTGAAVDNLGKHNLPSTEGLLYASVANIIKNIKSNKTAAGTLLNLAESLSELSQSTKDTMREEMPTFKKYFVELGVRARLLKDLLEKYGTDANAVVVIDIIYPKQIRASGERSLLSIHSRLLDRMIDISEIFEKATDDLIKELNVTIEYGELYPGFTKMYQSKNGSLPFVPPSLIFSYVFNQPLIVEDNNMAIQFIPATKSTVDRQLTAFVNGIDRVGSSQVIDMLVQQYDGTINGPERLRKEDIIGAITGYTTLVNYIGHCRQYKSMFTWPVEQADIASIVKQINAVTYPELVDKARGTYRKTSQHINIVTPWNIGFFVDSSATRLPGITLSTRTAVTVGYVNSYFVENSPSAFLGKIGNSTLDELMAVIFTQFGVADKMVVTADKDALSVANVLDMNIVPIDFSGFSAFIPFSNIMNYAYTLEKIALDVLIPNEQEHDEIAKKMITDDRMTIRNSESLMYALIINPFAPVPAGPFSDLLIHNMFKGISQLEIGRPKFLNDQMYQKLLLGENFENRDEYNETGRQIYKTRELMKTYDPTDVIELPVYRGAGESVAAVRNAMGIDYATTLINELGTILNRFVPLNALSFAVRVDNANIDTLGVILSLTIIDPATGNVAGPVDSHRIPGRLYDGSVNNNTCSLTLNGDGSCTMSIMNASGGETFRMDIPAGSHNVPTSLSGVALGNTWGMSQVDIPVIVGKILGNPVATGATTPNTYTGWLSKVREMLEIDSIEFISRLIGGSAGLRDDKSPETYAGEIITDLITSNGHKTINDYIPLTKGLSTFDSYGQVSNIVADVSKTAAIISTQFKFKSYLDAKTFVANNQPLFQTGAGNTATGSRAIEFLVKLGLSKGLKPRERSTMKSSINTAATGTATGHPLKNYFKPMPGFVSSAPGQTANSTNKVGDLNYIDSKKIGVSRIQTVSTSMGQDHKLLIGSNRFNSVLARMIIFMINSYRIVLYRLRQDAKNRTGVVARKPEEILDDNDTEFYGFDMYE